MTKQELQKLRQQITLNSLFTSDYTNTHNIDPRQVQDFFDSWLEYCSEDIETTNDNDLFEKANNIDNLYDYYIYMFEEDPLSKEFFEKYYQNCLTN